MKNILIALAVLSAAFAFADGDAPAETPACPVAVTVDDAVTSYNLAVVADADDVKGAKSYIDAYADNVQNDANFKANEATALATIRTENRFFGTWWAILPPLIAIFLALVTKEVYSSLFIGIVTGGLLYSGFGFEGTITHVMSDGFVKSVADGYNIGILLFLILLGALVSMMNKTGASAAFGRWAQTHIKSRVGAQLVQPGRELFANGAAVVARLEEARNGHDERRVELLGHIQSGFDQIRLGLVSEIEIGIDAADPQAGVIEERLHFRLVSDGIRVIQLDVIDA